MILGAPAARIESAELRDALAAAHATNPDITAARARLRGVDENVGIAKASGRPLLGATSTISQTFDDIGRFRDGGRVLDASADLSVPLYSGGRVRNLTRAADSRVVGSRADLRTIEGDVFTQVVAAYLNVIRDAYLANLSRSYVELLRANLDASQARFRGGDLTRTDVAQSEARLAAARSQLTAAEGDLTTSREEYRRVVGSWPVELESPPPLPTLPSTADIAVEIAVAGAPDLESVSASVRAAGFDVEVARALRRPVLSTSATASYVNYLGSLDRVAGIPSDRGLDQVQTTAVVGLAARIPLYQGGGPAARVRQAQAFESELEEQRVGVERAIIADVRAAFSDFSVATANITSNEVAVAANQLALRGAREENAAGTRTLLDVLNAEQELLESQVALIVAGRDRYVAGFSLLNAMGRAGADLLGLDGGALYDPLPNYERASRSLSDWADSRKAAPSATRTVGPTPLDRPAVAVMAVDAGRLPATESETISRPPISDGPGSAAMPQAPRR
ncbi:TolC family outer membrane protein [Sphingoaurantiacus capsulatus]|uniref:TolC family outer membrane protein n=1 Tax=Sphingoaurantiacus capsulatus TaxID=1771310 RepID=A0ABV7X6V8_9SPHN